MPADVGAAIVSAALLVELHAEPVATCSGAPVQVRDDGSFRIEFTANSRREWLPIASHRLTVRSHGEAVHVLSEPLPRGSLRGFGRSTSHRVRVEVLPEPYGCSLQLTAGTALQADLSRIVQRTLLLANSLEENGPGLAETNLAAWRLTQLLRTAAASDDDNRRGNLLRLAARQPAAPSSLFRDLAQLAFDDGRMRQAAAYLRRGLLAETDAFRRAELAGLADTWALAGLEPEDLREQALGLLVAGDLQTAEKLLHSARRNDSRPAIDYQLLAFVHRYRGKETAALAAQLLAREYDAASQSVDHSQSIANHRGIGDLGNRISRNNPVERAASKLYESASLLAAPPR